MANILVIDDERSIRETLREILEYEKHTVFEASDGLSALEMLNDQSYDVILCDIKMPKKDGTEVLDEAIKMGVDTPFIMVSAHGTIDTAVECTKKGAFDFIQKPPDLNRLLLAIRNATEKSHLVEETKVLKKKVKKGLEIVGESAAIKEVEKMIDRVAITDARVLITGANGTGKELIARQLHDKSDRSKKPLVEVNCAAIPPELIESELFGHEKGSFTSAHKQRIGKFELANGGTLFLDEIGDMSASAQAKVLRALQENQITRVGGEKPIAVSPRVIAATNKDLKKEIDEGRFREDLYHRLGVILIKNPSLAERREDIPLLIDHFLTIIAEEYGTKKKEIAENAVEELQAQPWTGNIRELRNVIERLVIMTDTLITREDVEKYV